MCYHAVDPHYRAWPVSYDVTPVYQNLFESVKPFIIFRRPLNPTDGRKDQRTNKLIPIYFLKFVCGGIIIAVHNSDSIMVCYEYRYFLCLHWTLIKKTVLRWSSPSPTCYKNTPGEEDLSPELSNLKGPYHRHAVHHVLVTDRLHHYRRYHQQSCQQIWPGLPNSTNTLQTKDTTSTHQSSEHRDTVVISICSS